MAGVIAATREQAVFRAVPGGAALSVRGELMLIRFTHTAHASMDGVHVLEYEPGAMTDAPVVVARSLIAQGVAELVNQADEARMDTHAPDTATEQALEASPVPGLVDMPDETATRAQHDAVAAALGLNTTGLPNKAAVRDAIADALIDRDEREHVTAPPTE